MNSPWSRIGEAERARRQAKRGSSRRKGKLGTRPDQNRSNAKLLPGMFKGPVNSGTCRRANSHWSAFAVVRHVTNELQLSSHQRAFRLPVPKPVTHSGQRPVWYPLPDNAPRQEKQGVRYTKFRTFSHPGFSRRPVGSQSLRINGKYKHVILNAPCSDDIDLPRKP